MANRVMKMKRFYEVGQMNQTNADEHPRQSPRDEVTPCNGTVCTDPTHEHDEFDRLKAQKNRIVATSALPLCPVHQSLEDRGELEVEYGSNCVACSLNERSELLEILADQLPDGTAWIDSVDFLRELLSPERDRACQAVVDALREAKETIRMWHGDLAWDTYEACSPEMKMINAALEMVEALEGTKNSETGK
jgi:hypothetical protein